MVTKKTHSYSDSVFFLKKAVFGVRKAFAGGVVAKSRRSMCAVADGPGFPHTCSHLHKAKRPLGPLSPSPPLPGIPHSPPWSWALCCASGWRIWPNPGTDCPPRPEFRTQQRGVWSLPPAAAQVDSRSPRPEVLQGGLELRAEGRARAESGVDGAGSLPLVPSVRSGAT